MTQSKTPITPTSGMPITEHPQYMAAMDAFRKERDIGKWVSVEGNGYVWPMFAMYWWPAWLQSRSTLEAEVEKLHGYARHKHKCLNDHPPLYKCTCGLEELLK